jgi:hypothetical protein
MKANPSSPNASRTISSAQNSTAGAESNHGKPVSVPSQAAVALRAYALYEKQGSQPGNEVKHWLEAEAQLMGGIERESQMRAGSSPFTSEH